MQINVAGPRPGPCPVMMHLDLEEDYVRITNVTEAVMPLKNWSLLSDTGSQLYDFPKRLKLKPGESVEVWSGRDSGKHHDPPHSFAWTKRFIWNNKGDKALLLDDKAHLVAVTEH